MSDKFTIVGFVAQALAEKWSYLQMAEHLAPFVPGLDPEAAAETILTEAGRYTKDQHTQVTEHGGQLTAQGADAIIRESLAWGVQAAIDDALPPTEPGTPEAKSTSYRHLGVTWAR